jgi:hypothetical protein
MLKNTALIAIGIFANTATAAPQDTDELEKGAAAHLNTDNVSIDVAFPAGGSALGTNSAGARLFLSPTMAIALNLQYSYDKEQEFIAYGGTLRSQWILETKGNAALYSFAQLSAGATKKTTTTNSATTSIVEESSTQTGGAGGAGFEIFFLPELSASAEIGLGGVFSPSNRVKISTATSQIALHFFFPK